MRVHKKPISGDKAIIIPRDEKADSTILSAFEYLIRNNEAIDLVACSRRAHGTFSLLCIRLIESILSEFQRAWLSLTEGGHEHSVAERKRVTRLCSQQEGGGR